MVKEKGPDDPKNHQEYEEKGPDDPKNHQEYVDLTVRITELNIDLDLKMILRLIVRKLYKM